VFLWSNPLKQEKHKITVKSKFVRKPFNVPALLPSGLFVETFHFLCQRGQICNVAYKSLITLNSFGLSCM
jgi:hypothetical protein